jgi:hypothetical protein
MNIITGKKQFMNQVDLNWLKETYEIVSYNRIKSPNRDWKIPTNDVLKIVELSIQAAEECDRMQLAMQSILDITTYFRGGHRVAIDAIMEVHNITKDSLR